MAKLTVAFRNFTNVSKNYQFRCRRHNKCGRIKIYFTGQNATSSETGRCVERLACRSVSEGTVVEVWYRCKLERKLRCDDCRIIIIWREMRKERYKESIIWCSEARCSLLLNGLMYSLKRTKCIFTYHVLKDIVQKHCNGRWEGYVIFRITILGHLRLPDLIRLDEDSQ